ncbi:hypothetical protein BTVI_96317 [Pitangus sulphuratus]|nr:hypothetical protein BTVI_96317 [Pitangus sulphuratus]
MDDQGQTRLGQLAHLLCRDNQLYRSGKSSGCYLEFSKAYKGGAVTNKLDDRRECTVLKTLDNTCEYKPHSNWLWEK